MKNKHKNQGSKKFQAVQNIIRPCNLLIYRLNKEHLMNIPKLNIYNSKETRFFKTTAINPKIFLLR